MLSFVPCADGAICIDQTNTKKEIRKTTPQESHSEKDHCSPFCQCACCGVQFSIVEPYIKSHILVIPTVKKSYSSFYSSSVKGISLPVWQPPQLS